MPVRQQQRRDVAIAEAECIALARHALLGRARGEICEHAGVLDWIGRREGERTDVVHQTQCETLVCRNRAHFTSETLSCHRSGQRP